MTPLPPEEFCRRFDAAPAEKRFLFGCNPYASTLAQHIHVSGIVDDFSKESTYAGLPVLRLSELPEDALVVSCLLGKPQTGKRVLDEAGVTHLDFFGFHRYCRADVPFVRFWGDYLNELEQHAQFYDWLEAAMSDAESRTVYRAIQQFRETADISHLEGFTERQAEQYFEAFIPYQGQHEVFVDVGCFDGYTSLEFARHCPDYGAIHVLEPSASNMAVVRERLAGLRDVVFHELGASDQPGIVQFDSSGSTSSITDSGAETVQVDAIDNLIQGPASFIKIDVEGEEMSVLRGARRLIEQHAPKLAVCVYHRTSDFREIPEYILSIREDYDIYLRHYTEGVVETVMFFIPRQTQR